VLRTAPYLGTDHIQPIVDDLSLEIGHRYRSSAVLPPDGSDDDGLPYVDPRESRALPGTRAPHLWLRDGVSTLDLFRKNMTLLTAMDGLEVDGVDVHRIDHPDFPEAYGIGPDGAVLVRPDGYVAWRVAEGASTAAVREALGSLLSASTRAAAEAS
jgi:putative polyketide hydroxylase